MAEEVKSRSAEDPQTESYEPSLEKQTLPEQSDFPEGGGRAWAVALGCSGLLFCTFGFANAFGIFQEYYISHQLAHKSASSISWIGSVQVFSLFASGLFGGPLFDRYGARIVWPAVFVYLLSVMMTSLCKEYYQFMLAQGILGGIGMGMTISPGLAATGQYFQKNRAAALGLAVAGSSLGGVIFPIALSKMLNSHKSTLSFGWTVRICGFLMLGISLPSAFAIRARLPPRKEKLFLPHAFTELPYVCLLAAAFFLLLGLFQPIFYLPTYAVSHGMNPQLADYLTAILNGASFFGRVIPGITADKFGRLNMLCIMGLCTGILCLVWQAVTSNGAIIAFAALYGFFSGAIVSLNSACLMQVPKDPRNIGTYMGMGMFVTAFAVLIGPPANGALVDHYHGFRQVSVFSGVVCLIGGIGVFGVKWTMGKGLWARA